MELGGGGACLWSLGGGSMLVELCRWGGHFIVVTIQTVCFMAKQKERNN